MKGETFEQLKARIERQEEEGWISSRRRDAILRSAQKEAELTDSKQQAKRRVVRPRTKVKT